MSQQTLHLLVEPGLEAREHGGAPHDDEAVGQGPPAVERTGEERLEDHAGHGLAVIVQLPQQLGAAFSRDAVNLK